VLCTYDEHPLPLAPALQGKEGTTLKTHLRLKIPKRTQISDIIHPCFVAPQAGEGIFGPLVFIHPSVPFHLLLPSLGDLDY